MTPTMSAAKLSRLTTPAIYKVIGARIRDERTALGFSQEDIAEHIGQNRTAITLIELGQQKVAVHELLAIAEALGVSVDCLLPAHMPESEAVS